ncbi:methyl-accepting chemotaxis protein [Desulfonauticus submarinus]
MFAFIKGHLNVKLLCIMALVSLTVFGSLITFMVHFYKPALLKQISLSCTEKADLMRLAIAPPMIIGDDEGTRHEFKLLAEKDKNLLIYLTDYNGNITYSTKIEHVRKDFDSIFSQRDIINLIHSGLKEVRQEQLITKIKHKNYFIRTMSIENRPECYHCHGSSRSILGELIVMQDISETMSNVHKQFYEMIAISIGGFLVLISVLWFFIRNIVIRPIVKISNSLKEIAEGEGDLTARLKIQTKDEIGKLAHHFNEFMENLQTMIKDIADNTETLNSSSSDLSELSTHISTETENMSMQFNAVVTSSEEVRSNMSSVASAMEQASTNVSLIATAAQQMSGAINKIAKMTEKTQTITQNAVSKVASASNKIGQLGYAAKEITTITETITAITEQTNLLALNATIEAARAGEAGKGFAVVANEIKELARQTVDSSEEIKKKIESIQASTEGSVAEVAEISEVIKQVNDVVSSIVAALEEQATTINEIASNVSEVSLGIQEVTENVAKSSNAASDVNKEIMVANERTNKLRDMSSQISLSAGKLLDLAKKLQHLVERFKI